jgi:predicted site-specific integrase-resolvase
MDIIEQAVQIVREQEVKALMYDVVSSAAQRPGMLQLIARHQEWAVLQLTLLPAITASLCNGTVTLEQLQGWLQEAIHAQTVHPA